MRRPQHHLYHRPGSPPPPPPGGPEGIILASSGMSGRGGSWVRYLRARLLGGSAAAAGGGVGAAAGGGLDGVVALGPGGSGIAAIPGASAGRLRHRGYALLALLMVGMVLLRVARHSMESVYRAEMDRRHLGPYGGTYTIRVNTFRRNDLLKGFLRHFTACPNVEQVQVVWSDQQNEPPPLDFFALPTEAQAAKVAFERQPTDSLNNRFRALLPVPTPAVLSLDDDLEIPCAQLDFAYGAWQASPRSLVGFTPRLATWDPASGGYRYQSSFKMVWWHGLYNIVLTKCCFLHRDYLAAYFDALTPEMLAYIDARRNCEDLAMQFVVSNASQGAPPVWVRAGRFTDHGVTIGISQGSDHERERSDCLNRLAKEFGRFPLTLTSHKAVDARRQLFF